MRPAAASEVDGVAVAAQRLAVLLSAGIAPVTAWRYLASSDASSCRREATAAARAARAGDDVGGAVLAAAERGSAARQDAWAALVALWRVADVSGAPPASSLRSLAVSLRELGAVRRQVDVALAGPAATARMVLLMPAVAVLLGVALGFDTVTILLATPLGIACTVMAVGLIVVGARWNRRMVRRATPHERAPGLALELLAVALSGGVSVQRARSLVERSLPPRLQAVRDELAAARGILLIASSAGVPAAELLRSEASARRAAAVTAAERAAVALSVRLMLPLGTCVLPAFMLVGVLPLLFSIMSSTVTGLA
jgi:tight adherence protein B